LPPTYTPWIIDTRAIDHMVNCVSLFTTITSTISISIKLPNGGLVSITYIGMVRISEHFILTNVLCIPSFSLNLISTTKLIQHLNCCFIFITSYYFIQNLTNWETFGVGEEKGGLFHLTCKQVFCKILCKFCYSQKPFNRPMAFYAKTFV
jgi:hypothetical protein